MLWRLTNERYRRHSMALNMHANIDPSVDRIVQTCSICTLTLMELIYHLLAIYLIFLPFLSLTELGDLSQAPVHLLIVRFIALIGLLLLLNHRGVKFVPGEHFDVRGLVGVKLLLKAHLKAGFEQVYLHLGWRVKCVTVNSRRFHFELFHVFFRRNRLIVQSGRTGLVC